MAIKDSIHLSKNEFINLNKKLVPWNVIILLVAVTVSAMLFFGNFFRVTFILPLHGLSDIISGENIDFEAFSEYDAAFLAPFDEYNSADDSYSGWNWGNILEDLDFSLLDEITIRLSVVITNRSLIRGAFGNPAQAVLEDTLAHLAEQIPPILNTLTNTAIRIFITNAVRIAYDHEDEIPDVLAALDTGDLTLIINNILGGEYIADQTYNRLIALLTNTLYRMDIDPDISENIIEEFSTQLEEIIEALYEFADNMGHINIGRSTLLLLANLLDINIPDDLPYEQLAASIASYWIAQMDSATARTLNILLIPLIVVLLLTILVWVLLAVFAVFRLLAKNKSINLGWARGFGWVAFSFFVILPAILWLIAPHISALSYIAYLVDAGFRARFMAMTLASFIGAVVLMIIRYAGYGRLKKQIKRAIITD